VSNKHVFLPAAIGMEQRQRGTSLLVGRGTAAAGGGGGGGGGGGLGVVAEEFV
jgi:hypothetical protein